MKLLFGVLGALVTLIHCAVSVAVHDRPNHWAVLVAGSKTYMNYRHQADIAHAYHILRSNGYREEQIITLMYDDVANSYMNPYPGTLINKPGGKDYYKGLKIDYKGSDVTAKTFEKVLLGEETNCGNGKTLKSGPNDHVFIYFADHGGTGLIAFPTGIMTSKAMHTTLKKMYQRKLYDRLVFYLEACESGSMFDDLDLSGMNMFTTTAATASQSSYAIYWDMERRAFLGDRYSVFWMEDSDKYFSLDSYSNPKETLEDQFNRVYELVNPNSQPQQYGDIKYASNTGIEEFQANEPAGVIHNRKPKSMFGLLMDYLKGLGMNGGVDLTTMSNNLPVHDDAVSSRDVTLQTLYRMRDMDTGSNSMHGDDMMLGMLDKHTLSQMIEEEIRNKQEAMDRFKFIAYQIDEDLARDYYSIEKINNKTKKLPIHHDCLHKVLMSFDEMCHAIDEYHIAHTGVLNHLCDKHAADVIVNVFAQSHLCHSA